MCMTIPTVFTISFVPVVEGRAWFVTLFKPCLFHLFIYGGIHSHHPPSILVSICPSNAQKNQVVFFVALGVGNCMHCLPYVSGLAIFFFCAFSVITTKSPAIHKHAEDI